MARTKWLKIRISEDELNLLRGNVKDAKMNFSTYVRTLIFMRSDMISVRDELATVRKMKNLTLEMNKAVWDFNKKVERIVKISMVIARKVDEKFPKLKPPEFFTVKTEMKELSEEINKMDKDRKKIHKVHKEFKNLSKG